MIVIDNIQDLKMIKNKVLVHRNELEDTILDGGIIITKSAQQRTNNGTVLSVGPDVKNIKPGDKVCFVNLIFDISADYAICYDKDVILKWI